MRDPVLPEPTIRDFLDKNPKWLRNTSGAMEATFEMPSFVHVIGLVYSLGAFAEASDHHPDFDVRFNKLTVRLFTYDSHGLTWRDLQMAETVQRLAISTAKEPIHVRKN